jgi:uncharacterized membrane protein
MQWYYTRQGQQVGPIDEAELHRLAQQGVIQPDDLVWNPSMGGQWRPASSVEGLYAAVPTAVAQAEDPEPQPAPPGGGGTTHNRDLMRMARESLRSRWGLGAGVWVLYLLVCMGSGHIPVLGTIASLLITGPMYLGLCLVSLRIARRQPTTVAELFQGFNRFGTALAAYLLMGLFIVLWSLLFLIPGIIAMYAYLMTFFVIADDPTVGPLEAITRSKEMMRGNKWKAFCLIWRFFGWMLLCMLTLGIGYIWLGPYMQTTMAHFYDDIRPRN